MTPSALELNLQALELAVTSVGSVTALARALGVRLNVVGNWRKRGVPDAWIARVSKATGGRVRCDQFDPVKFPPADEGRAARAA